MDALYTAVIFDAVALKTTSMWPTEVDHVIKSPLYDAYLAPLKHKHHYWFGALLLVRGILLVTFASSFTIPRFLLSLVALSSLHTLNRMGLYFSQLLLGFLLALPFYSSVVLCFML